MRLTHICAIATSMLLLGGVASGADAKAKAKPSSGGAAAPSTSGGTGVSGTGVTGTTGTTGTTSATSPTAPLAALAPIVLGPHQTATSVYAGPVFELTPVGLVAYVPASDVSSSSGAPSSVAGGTTAAGSSSATNTNALLSTTLPQLEVPGSAAELIRVGGVELAAAPEDAPPAVQEVIWAGNRLVGLPYLWGGGHRSFYSPRGYDCSGTVSFALHGAGLLNAPLDSGQFMRWGSRGQGAWMTILTNPGHAYIDVAGVRLDTSSENDPSDLQGPRWRPLRPTNAGFVKRHPIGY